MDLRGKLSRLGGAGPGSRTVTTPEERQASLQAGAAGPGGVRAEGAGGPRKSIDPDAARRARIEQLRTLIRRTTLASHPEPLPEQPTRIDPEISLPGEERATVYGRLHVVTRFLEPHHCHGRVRVASALSVSTAAVARLALDPALERVDPRRMLYVDTETTGLAGGAGTLPFLIGLAWFEDESLCVQQLFLRRPGEEVPMLHALAERLRKASCLVTYNGKSFDWPLLRTRFVLNRVPMPEPPPHLDLLHCARRVFRGRLSAVRLVSVEREALGMRREDDVDGADIPALYLRWLRRGEASPLAPVIEHNANDLVALAAIVARLANHYETLRPDDDPRDHLGFARVALRSGDVDRAAEFAQAAADGGGDSETTVAALRVLARLARRTGDAVTEERALTRALACAESGAAHRLPALHLRLAKLYEHRLRDPVRARAHAAHAELAETSEAHARRLARLERRMARARQGQVVPPTSTPPA